MPEEIYRTVPLKEYEAYVETFDRESKEQNTLGIYEFPKDLGPKSCRRVVKLLPPVRPEGVLPDEILMIDYDKHQAPLRIYHFTVAKPPQPAE